MHSHHTVGSADAPDPRSAGPAGAPEREIAGRPVLVTGARSFIGRHLLRHLLDAGAIVHATTRPGGRRARRDVGLPGRPRVSWHEVDLADAAAADGALRATDPDVVIHLASEVAGHRDPEPVRPMMEDDVGAAVNIVTSAHLLGGRRVLLAGSVEEPRDAGEASCSPPGASRAAATTPGQLFHQQRDLPVTVLRPTMVYGPGQPDETELVPYAINAMLAGEQPSFGSGTRFSDWVHVDDVCRAFLAAATRPTAAGLVADIGSGTATSIADTVEVLARLCGFDGPLGLGAVADPRHDTAHVADLTAAHHVLGWRPEVPLAVGLAQTVQWHRSRLEFGSEHDCAPPRDRGPHGHPAAVVGSP